MLCMICLNVELIKANILLLFFSRSKLLAAIIKSQIPVPDQPSPLSSTIPCCISSSCSWSCLEMAERICFLLTS